jgi:hypothetical protein
MEHPAIEPWCHSSILSQYNLKARRNAFASKALPPLFEVRQGPYLLSRDFPARMDENLAGRTEGDTMDGKNSTPFDARPLQFSSSAQFSVESNRHIKLPQVSAYPNLWKNSLDQNRSLQQDIHGP